MPRTDRWTHKIPGTLPNMLRFTHALFFGIPGTKSGYAQDWYDRVAKETGERYLMPSMGEEKSEEYLLNKKKLKVLSKQA